MDNLYAHGWGYGRGVVFIELLWLLLLLATAVLAGLAVTRLLAGRSPTSAGAPTAPAPPTAPPADPAIEQLRLRYARGEIGADEYRTVARDLGHEVPPPDDAGG